MFKKTATLFVAGALLLSISMPQQATAGDLGNFLRSIKEQGKQALKNQLNTVINGGAAGGYGGVPSYSAPTYGSTPNYDTQSTYAPAQCSPTNDYANSTQQYTASSSTSAPLDPSIYEMPGTTQSAPVSSYSTSQAHITPGPVINGFGSRRASIH